MCATLGEAYEKLKRSLWLWERLFAVLGAKDGMPRLG